MSTDAPYLSVVAAAAGDGRLQAQAFVDSWGEQAKRHSLSVEVIVEPSRNAAIRKARGEFVLATAIGDTCSDELMQFLASRTLTKGRLYRADRYDGASRVWAREGVFPLTPEGLRANGSDDVTAPQSGIHFGAGWFPASQGGRFFGPDAEIVIQRRPYAWAAMELEIEPGPGIGMLPAKLQAIDDAGNAVAEWEIESRTTVRMWLPPTTKRFRLRTPNGGSPTPFDLHIFNFRCLRADWTESRPPAVSRGPSELTREKRPTLARCLASWRKQGPAALLRAPWAMQNVLRLLGGIGEDVFGPGIEYWGTGWSYREHDGGETFRWASEDVELVVRLNSARCSLAMLVEPGPGVGGGSFVLRAQLGDGTILGRAEVRGATYVNMPLPEFHQPIVRLLIGPEGGAKAVDGDSRVLGFRVFACACEADNGAKRRETIPAGGRWVAVTTGASPADIDWPEKLHDCRALIDEMGKPEDLHLNGSGDFTLMAREHWLDLRGYPELDMPSTDLDALLCIAAHHAGICEEVLAYPMRVCRLENGQDEPSPAVTDDVVWAATQMRRLRSPAIFNRDTWGLEG